MSAAEKVADHGKIRKWARSRGGRPAKVKDIKGSSILRSDLQEPDERLEKISRDEFFEIFEDNTFALLEQEETRSGAASRFFKFVER